MDIIKYNTNILSDVNATHNSNDYLNSIDDLNIIEQLYVMFMRNNTLFDDFRQLKILQDQLI